MSNNENNPSKCESKLCCRATAKLKMQIAKELEQKDRSIAQLIEEKEEKEADENNDPS